VIEVPKTAIELAKRFEGFHRVPKVDPRRAHPYICPAGYWTIGYGHLCEPTHLPITETEAESIWRTTCKRRSPRRCATARCSPPNPKGDFRPR